MEFQCCLHCMSVQSTEKNEQVIMNAVQSDAVYLSWALLVLSFVCLFVCFFLPLCFVFFAVVFRMAVTVVFTVFFYFT